MPTTKKMLFRACDPTLKYFGDIFSARVKRVTQLEDSQQESYYLIQIVR